MSEKARNANTYTPLTNDKKPTKSETLIEKQKTSRGIMIIVIIPKQSIMRQKQNLKTQNKKDKQALYLCYTYYLILDMDFLKCRLLQGSPLEEKQFLLCRSCQLDSLCIREGACVHLHWDPI